MSTVQKETIREKIARQMAEEDAKVELRKVENEKKLAEADDKTVEKYLKLVAKANKKAADYATAVAKVASIEKDYDDVIVEVLRYQSDVQEIGRESELIHVTQINAESDTDSTEDEVQVD